VACDDSNETGSGTFFLYDANSLITDQAYVVITYHASLADAQNEVNPLTSPYTSTTKSVFARVEIILMGCVEIATLDLSVGAKCPENCNNGVDEDGDGLIDCDDPDCPCCDTQAPLINGVNKKDP